MKQTNFIVNQDDTFTTHNTKAFNIKLKTSRQLTKGYLKYSKCRTKCCSLIT